MPPKREEALSGLLKRDCPYYKPGRAAQRAGARKGEQLMLTIVFAATKTSLVRAHLCHAT